MGRQFDKQSGDIRESPCPAGRHAPPAAPRHARCTARRLRRARVDRRRGPRPSRPRRIPVRSATARRRRVRAQHRRRARGRVAVLALQRAADSVRRRLVARRPPARGARRRVARPVRNEPRAVDQRRRPDRDGRAGHHAQGAQRSAARHRPVLPDRSGRRRQHRRDDRDPRIGHQRRTLRHDARERARPDRGARGRPRGENRLARASRRPATTSRACSSGPKARSA